MRSINYSDKRAVEKIKKEETIKTGNPELDSFLSTDGGLVVGSAIFFTGTPGAGKTTFSAVLQQLLKDVKTSLYSREMSKDSVLGQMKRYKINHKNAFIADKDCCENINEYIKELNELKPSVVIIDSLQFIINEDFANVPVGDAVFQIIQTLRKWTEENKAVLIVIGHVNKDGGFEGKNIIEHMFDAHLEMIYNKAKGTRILSWSKNRKGTTNKILFYSFGEKTIEFYTKEQYDKTKNNKTLDDFLIEAIGSYIDAIDKKNPNYPQFKHEMKKFFATVQNKDIDSMDMIIESIHTIKEKIDKYSL